MLPMCYTYSDTDEMGVMVQRLSRRRLVYCALAAPAAIASFRSLAAEFEPVVVARNFADLVRSQYHNAETGGRLAALVESKCAAGSYDDKRTAALLAEALMRDAAAVTGDKHFYVMAGMDHGAAPSIRPGARNEHPDAAWLEKMRADNFGVGKAEIVNGAIGLIEVRRFYSPYEEAKAALGDAMKKVEAASALVFDLTGNIGGDPAGVAYLSSFLFERPPFVINRFHWRSGGVEEFWTTRDLTGPGFPESRPVIVATSRSTFSAGEEFAYNLQVLSRATIVGESTGGGANHAEAFPLGAGIIAFIPCARAENPITLSNWEGVGVVPDTPAHASQAVATAIGIAGNG